MREKIKILILTTFLVTGIKAIPKDSVIYSFKAGVISPYCFKYKKYDEIATTYNTTYSWPFNAGFTIGLDASRKNFSFELSLDISSFRRLSHKRVNDTLLGIRDIPFGLTQFKFLPQYRIIYSENSSLNIGCGITMARPSRIIDFEDTKESYYLRLGNGICYTANYTYQLPKRRSSFYAGILYEKLNNEPSWGPKSSKYDFSQSLHVPIYMVSLGVKYNIWRK
jgi:hypothetical protein